MVGLDAAREGCAAQLATIPGLIVHARPPGDVNTPAAVIMPAPDTFLVWDTSMDRGSDDLFLVIRLLVADTDDQVAQATLDRLLAPTGPHSVKQAVEADHTFGGLVHDAAVTEARDYGMSTYGGARYFGCELLVHLLA